VMMRVKSTTTAIVLMLPMLLVGATKTDWEDWNRHGFNHPYHECSKPKGAVKAKSTCYLRGDPL
jgi:hypothetical protein